MTTTLDSLISNEGFISICKQTNSIYRLFKETLPLLDKLIKGEIHQRELAPILFDLGGVLDYTIALKQTEISIGSRLINIYREGNNLLNALKKLK